MSETSVNNNENSTDIFNILSFERKLVELVEELRLRRNLENENEKTLKSLMDEKYKLELSWDEEQRKFTREKEDLEQTIELLKRKLEDKICVSDDDKAKQHVINRTYSHELKMLKEELRSTKSEKLNFLKKIQELEGKLSLHNNFQENIVSQVAEVGKKVKSIFEESQMLTAAQNNVMENVASIKESIRKFDLCNQHLLKFSGIVGKKNESLKKELVRCQSEVTMLQNTVSCERESRPKNNLEVENLQKKVLELENLLLLSRKENEKTLHNFVESNNLLCKFMDKYSENQNQERKLTRELELSREKLRSTERKLQDCQDKMKRGEETALMTEKQRVENQRSVETQTDKEEKQCNCSLYEESTSNAVVPIPLEDSKTDGDSFLKEMRQDLMDLQEISNQRRTEGFQLSGGKKITFSEVLKRKMEVSDSGDRIEMISMKKRIFENNQFEESHIQKKEETVSLKDTEEPVPKHESDHKMKAFGWSMDRKFLLSLENEPDEETS